MDGTKRVAAQTQEPLRAEGARHCQHHGRVQVVESQSGAPRPELHSMEGVCPGADVPCERDPAGRRAFERYILDVQNLYRPAISLVPNGRIRPFRSRSLPVKQFQIQCEGPMAFGSSPRQKHLLKDNTVPPFLPSHSDQRAKH